MAHTAPVSDSHRTDYPDTRSAVPRAALVVRAFSDSGGAGGGHPVLAVAAKLAAEHRMRTEAHRLVHDPHADDHVLAAAARTVTARDIACAVLIEQIDRCVTSTMGKLNAPVLHTESLGQLIDRLANVWTRCRLLADDRIPAANPRARMTLHQLAELSVAYDDLVTDLHTGRRRLPIHQTPTGPDPVA